MVRYVTVVMHKANYEGWLLKRLLKDHVFVVIHELGSSEVTVIDPVTNRMWVDSTSREAYLRMARNICVIDTVTVEYPKHIRPVYGLPIELLTCVTVIKRLLGIHNRWIHTPRQLMRYLKR